MAEYGELQKALELIRAECSRHGNSCQGCPLERVDSVCGVVGEPLSYGNGDYKKKPQNWNLPRIKLIAPKEGK